MITGEPDMDWAEWDTDDTRDEATRLLALREYIVREARRFRLRGDITADWANKKLASLGITEQVEALRSYVMAVVATGTAEVAISARNRAEAERLFRDRIANATVLAVNNPAVTGDLAFVSGPLDPDGTVNPDAPTTVQGTLDKLREVLLMGVIAGPKLCAPGVNGVLETFGLASVPERKQYVITRQTDATLRTVVEAYDEVSAERVAEWRWEDGRKGFTVAVTVPTGDYAVDEN